MFWDCHVPEIMFKTVNCFYTQLLKEINKSELLIILKYQCTVLTNKIKFKTFLFMKLQFNTER